MCCNSAINSTSANIGASTRSLPATGREVAKLSQVQGLKRGLMQKAFRAKILGDLAEGTATRATQPASEHRAWWCFQDLKFDDKGKPLVTLGVTTPHLCHRWSHGKIAAVDRAHKFNVLGWPVTMMGVINPAGRYGLCGLLLDSVISLEQTIVVFHGFGDAVGRVTGASPAKSHSVSDGEIPLREAAASAFGSKPVMCWFHVKKMVKEYLQRWVKGPLETRKAADQ